MPSYPTMAKFILRGSGQPDEQYLDQWRDAPLTFQHGQKIDESWHSDHHEYVFGEAAASQEMLFKRASDLILRYEFYPPSVLTHVSDFSRENRNMRVGDRIVQRIRSRFLPIEGMTMNEVTEVIDEPSRAGFTYVTTSAHAEMGAWSALVEREKDHLKLTIAATSRTRPEFLFFLRGYARWAQKNAHKQGILNFMTKVLEQSS
jgi:uncharacterized protein (UPF0548 family)